MPAVPPPAALAAARAPAAAVVAVLLLAAVRPAEVSPSPPAAVAPVPSPTTEPTPPPAPDSVSLVDLDGRPADPLADGAVATVFLFVRTDCPISNRYAPEVRRLWEGFAPRGVAFFLVYPDPGEEPATIRESIADFDYPFPALRDPEHRLVARAGATVTP
jgi:hypothetical protein